MKIFDCVIYNGEDHLLEIRLNELRNVDFFVIVESNISFSGIKKEYKFSFEKFEPYRKKIRYLQIGDELAKYQNKTYYQYFKHKKWQREFAIRDAILYALHDCEPNDIVVLSDIDELPDLTQLNQNDDIFIFKQICCQFKFNLMNPGLTPHYGSKAIKFKYLGLPSEFRIFDQTHLGIDSYNELRKKTIHGGFHFSYCLTVTKIMEKIKYYSHYERAKNVSRRQIEKCIIDQKDIWNGVFNHANKTKHLEKIPINILPKFIQNNMNRFKDFLV